MTIQDTLAAIKPGKNYPVSVSILDDGKRINFSLCSYLSGMYCAVDLDGKLVAQTGDHNNKAFVTGLKRDILKALRRGATVEIGPLAPCKAFVD